LIHNPPFLFQRHHQAVVIGIFAGLFYVLGSRLLIRLRIDDAVDAIPVHMVGGAWGLISTGLLSSPDLIAAAYSENPHSGWFYEWSQGSGDFTLIGAQLCAVLFVFGWTFTLMGFWFGLMNFFGWFRVDPLEEKVGMDFSRHKGAAYDYTSPNHDELKALSDSRHSRKSIDLSNDGSSKRGPRNNKQSSGGSSSDVQKDDDARAATDAAAPESTAKDDTAVEA
jgi:Ammonium Transporter Family